MNDRQYRILITGGSGFIGTNLVDRCLRDAFDVLNVDLREPKLDAHRSFWLRGDLLDIDAIREAVERFRPTHVVHLAARTDLGGTTLSDYALNTLGTQNLATVLSSVEGLQHVIFTSSMLVCRPGYIPVHDTDFAFSTVYGESKAIMENWIRGAGLPYRWNIVRPSSIWGPWFGTPYRDFFDRVLQGKMYKIGGKPSATKTYGFVLNSVFQLQKILFNQDVSRQVFYLGDNPPLNVNDWADFVALRAGLKLPSSIPYSILKVAAVFGDVFRKIGIDFPLTSFRLHNMTTDNIVPLDNLYTISGPHPYTLQESVDLTLEWLKSTQQK